MNRAILARGRASTRALWALGVAAFAALLVVGSIHPSVPTKAQRIANLENVLKCPACADASLAQSETLSAIQLRSTITSWVSRGLSDQQIESRLVSSYGPGELLRPKNAVIWIVPVVAVAVAIFGLTVVAFGRRGSSIEISEEEEARVLALLADGFDDGGRPRTRDGAPAGSP